MKYAWVTMQMFVYMTVEFVMGGYMNNLVQTCILALRLQNNLFHAQLG